MSTLRFRFVFNHGTGKAAGIVKPTNAKKFADAIVRDVAVEYAEKTYNEIRTRIATTIAGDVQAEIQNVASLFNKYVVGAAEKRAGPTGALNGLASLSQAFYKSGIRNSASLAGIGSPWAPRSHKYLVRKGHRPPRGVGHYDWFKYSGLLGREIRKSSTWINSFGPIQVKVVRLKSTPLQTRSGTHTHVGVCRIEVRALGNITAEMLPALATGQLGGSGGDGRKNGLLGLVVGHNPELASHLGGNSATTPYRATLEPFLSFVLTRSIPNAVFRRVEQGLAVDRTGSGGRTR